MEAMCNIFLLPDHYCLNIIMNSKEKKIKCQIHRSQYYYLRKY